MERSPGNRLLCKDRWTAAAILFSFVCGMAFFGQGLGICQRLSAATERQRPELAYGVPGEYLERHGYLIGKPGHYTPWAAEYLTSASFVQRAARTDFTFYADPDVPEEFRATLWDYHGSGYDRGHMAPAADCEHGAMAMRDCFRLSNMMPQTPELNRGEWRKLEEHVRSLAKHDDAEVWVITGPCWPANEVGEVRFETLGAHQVWIPSHCFKAVLVKRGKNLSMKAWIVPNTTDPPAFDECKATVDQVETAAGLDLFAGLADDVEEKLEAAK